MEAHLQELLAAHPATLGDGWTLVRREYLTAIGPVDLLCRDAAGAIVAVEVKRRGEIDGVEQLTRYLELLNRDPLLAPVTGVFAAQQIKPQARTLAAGPGDPLRGGRLRRAARPGERRPAAVLTGKAGPSSDAPLEPSPTAGPRAAAFGRRHELRDRAGRGAGGAVRDGGVVDEGLPVPRLRPAHSGGLGAPGDLACGRARHRGGPATLAQRVLGAPAAPPARWSAAL